MNSKNLVIATVFLVAFSANCLAQQKTKICIVDLAKVFKNHPTFNQQLQQLQTDAEAFKRLVNQQKQQLITRREKMMNLDVKSAEFKSEESILAQIAAKLEVDANNGIKDLTQREADLHFATYQQVQRLIGAFCQQRGISIVMTYSNEEVDPNDPNSIMARVNSNVVYSRPDIDITMAIIQGLASNRTAIGPGTPNNNK